MQSEPLDVVAHPVAAAEIELHCHVVDVLIDIEQLPDLLVCLGVGSIGGECDQLFVGIVGAALLHIERVGSDLELVDLVVAPSVVGIDIVLVVRLSHVEHADVLAVDELVGRLIALPVDIHTAREDDGLDGPVFQSVVVIVSSVSYLQCPVSDIWLRLEERIYQFVVPTQFFASFQLERMWSPCAAPTAAHLQVDILVEHHLSVSGDIREVDGSFPVHIPVASRALSVARSSVGSLDIDADGVVVEEVRVADDRDDRQRIVFVA